MKSKLILIGLLTTLCPINNVEESFVLQASDLSNIQVKISSSFDGMSLQATMLNKTTSSRDNLSFNLVDGIYYSDDFDIANYSDIIFTIGSKSTKTLNLDNSYPCFVISSHLDGENYKAMSLTSFTPTTTKVSLKVVETAIDCNVANTIYFRISNDYLTTNGAYIYLRDSASNKLKKEMELLEDDGDYKLLSYTMSDDEVEKYVKYDVYDLNDASKASYITISNQLNTATPVYNFSGSPIKSSYTYHRYDDLGIRFGIERLDLDFYDNCNYSDLSFVGAISYTVSEDTYQSRQTLTLDDSQGFYQGAYGVLLDKITLPGVSDNYNLILNGTIYLVYEDVSLSLNTRSFSLKTLVKEYLDNHTSSLTSSEIDILNRLDRRIKL